MILGYLDHIDTPLIIIQEPIERYYYLYYYHCYFIERCYESILMLTLLMLRTVDWNDAAVVTTLFQLFLGTLNSKENIKAEDRRVPACTRLRLKLFTYLIRSREASTLFPFCIQVALFLKKKIYNKFFILILRVILRILLGIFLIRCGGGSRILRILLRIPLVFQRLFQIQANL